MMNGPREALARIKRLDQLVAYLRDAMGWPIETDDFDELTFDYTAEELGIDQEASAKIKSIKRLRPLSENQPWGIFFVMFEPKRLPVVALRRILSSVVLKKRTSANAADRAAWKADDLLFLSDYGTGEERRISFAHFSTPATKDDLPTLRVLGWDNLDTALHLDAVAQELQEHLRWPEDETNVATWREQWSAAFTLRHREVVTTSKQLSIRLAALARAIRDRIKTALAIETEKGPLTQLMKAFKTALVHDLEADGFADMYAQTIAYGLLSARIADPKKKTADDFAAHMRTNPFLRELMETFLRVGGRRGKAGGPGIDFDELGVSEVVELLDAANMEAVVRDFGDRNPQEDPVIRFYEDFLREYDPEEKKRRGVFYTPRPVVSYIVRSVDALLRTDYGLEDGLADITDWGAMAMRSKGLVIPEGVQPDQPFVQILDPATGTGTFLVEVIDLVHKTMVAKWRAQGHGEKKTQALWNEYVPAQLLPRLHGYELLMAPYAIAHLKIGLKLYATGYRFESAERARVYLTNALEPHGDGQLAFEFLPALAHEAAAVGEIKRTQRFTVVIGNPPYSGLSSNMGPWIDGLLKGRLPEGTTTSSYYLVDGKPLAERKVWLQDDYVKFIRLSQWLLNGSGAGVHGYISNHGYLENPTFRGMRYSLLQSFRRVQVLDLHGNLKKKEVPPEGGLDGNVFDIQQGVAIGLFSKGGPERAVCHADLWGSQRAKYDWLLNHSGLNTGWVSLEPALPFYLFKPFDSTGTEGYFEWPRISEVMPVNVTGVVTARDEFVIDFNREDLRSRIVDLRSRALSDDAIRQKYFVRKGSKKGGKEGRKKYPPGDSRGWKLPKARQAVREDAKWDERYAPVLYRPFDVREIYYASWMVDWPRSDVMPHLFAGENLSITFHKREELSGGYAHFFCARIPTEHGLTSSKTTNYQAPLYIYSGVSKADRSQPARPLRTRGRRTPNLDPGFVHQLAGVLGLRFVGDGRGDLSKTLGPEDVLAYIYAVFHSPAYRERYKGHLKLDFPRVPPLGNVVLFRSLAAAGRKLLSLHLLESPDLGKPITGYEGPRGPKVGRVGWSSGTVWVDARETDARRGMRATRPGTIGFHGVPENVWDFHIGGYRVCHKWLKDRKGRTLSAEDVAHYQRIVLAVSETIRLMEEIDQLVEQHGGWPEAFQASGRVHEDPLSMVAEPEDEYGASETGDEGGGGPGQGNLSFH